MLILIDNKRELYVDDSFIGQVGAEGLKSTFMQTRINEQITKGRCTDLSFKLGKRSLLIYPSGQSIVTHVPVQTILKKRAEQQQLVVSATLLTT